LSHYTSTQIVEEKVGLYFRDELEKGSVLGTSNVVKLSEKVERKEFLFILTSKIS